MEAIHSRHRRDVNRRIRDDRVGRVRHPDKRRSKHLQPTKPRAKVELGFGELQCLR
jgi:hypothetical protein